jgi:hypothetical protein
VHDSEEIRSGKAFCSVYVQRCADVCDAFFLGEFDISVDLFHSALASVFEFFQFVRFAPM